MTNVKRHLLTSLGAIVLAASMLPAAARADADEAAQHTASVFAKSWGFPDPIEGLWNVKVYFTPSCDMPLPPQPAFLAMALFGRGGTFHDENSSTAPSPLFASRSEAFGEWRHERGRTYSFAFQFYRFDAAGTYLGGQIVRQTVRLARDYESYTSQGSPELLDVDGNPIPWPGGSPPCSRTTAVRFK